MLSRTTRSLLLLILVDFILARQHKQPKESANAMPTKQGRVFSLFSVVQFPNDVCDTSSSTQTDGVCLALSECSAKSGTASGNCAAGFGVCCLFSLSTCDTTVSNNVTYITNPGFPAAYTATGNCKFTVNKCDSSICQLRLDFETHTMGIMPTDAIVANSFFG